MALNLLYCVMLYIKCVEGAHRVPSSIIQAFPIARADILGLNDSTTSTFQTEFERASNCISSLETLLRFVADCFRQVPYGESIVGSRTCLVEEKAFH